MTAYRYLKLDCISTSGGGVFAFYEITVAATKGGASVLTGGVASASSTFGGFSAAAAVDGNPSTGWASTSAANEWWKYDRGAGNAIDVSAGDMSLAARNDNSANQLPFSAVLRGSNDDVTYTDIFTFVGVSAPALGEIVWAPAPTTGTFFDANRKSATVGFTTSTQLVATSSGSGSVAVNRSMTGKHYAEFVITTLTGTPVVGIVSQLYNMATGTLLGGDANSVGYRSGGAVVANGVTLATLAAYVAGDRIGVAVDPANRLIWFRVNNGNWNNNALNNPATGVGGIDYASVVLPRVFFACGFSLTGAKWTAKFSTPFTDAAPAGFASNDDLQTTVGQATAIYEGPLATTPSFATINGQSYGNMGRITRWFSPGGALTYVSGIVEESGVPVAGKVVEVYDRDTGELIGRTFSAGDGTWSVVALGRASVRIVCSDPTAFNSLVYDNVAPV